MHHLQPPSRSKWHEVRMAVAVQRDLADTATKVPSSSWSKPSWAAELQIPRLAQWRVATSVWSSSPHEGHGGWDTMDSGASQGRC